MNNKSLLYYKLYACILFEQDNINFILIILKSLPSLITINLLLKYIENLIDDLGMNGLIWAV